VVFAEATGRSFGVSYHHTRSPCGDGAPALGVLQGLRPRRFPRMGSGGRRADQEAKSPRPAEAPEILRAGNQVFPYHSASPLSIPEEDVRTGIGSFWPVSVALGCTSSLLHSALLLGPFYNGIKQATWCYEALNMQCAPHSAMQCGTLRPKSILARKRIHWPNVLVT